MHHGGDWARSRRLRSELVGDQTAATGASELVRFAARISARVAARRLNREVVQAMKLVNWKLIAHPMNWAVVVMMLLIAGAGAHLIAQLFGHTPDTADRKSAWTEQPAGQSPGQEAAGAIDPQGSLQM